MKRNEFISQLKEELLLRGFDEGTVNAEMEPVKSYFEENGIKDVDVPVDEMADEITQMIREADEEKKAEKKTAQNPPQAEPFVPSGAKADADGASDGNSPVCVDDEIEDALKAIKDTPQEDTADTVREEEDSDMKIASRVPETEDADMTVFAESPDASPVKQDNDDISYLDEASDISEFSPGGANKGKQKKKPAKKRAAEPPEDEPVSDGQYEDEASNKYDEHGRLESALAGYQENKVLFWVVFAVALPIIIGLSAVAVGLYIGFWIVLALLMIGTVAALIIFVTAGVLVALIGIVYGVIQLIKGNGPVGMFEAGLGITVGAAVLFISILVYNFAIRLIPFAMKQLARLLAFAFKKGRDGFVALKGVLDRI